MTSKRRLIGWFAVAWALVACSSDGTDTSATTVPTAATAASETDDTGPATTDGPSASSEPSSSSGSVSAPVDTEPGTSIDLSGDQAAAEAALLVLSDFEPGWSELAEDEDDESDLAAKRQITECAGGGGRTAADFGGGLATTGNFMSPNDELVDEVVSFAPTVEAATERMARFTAAEFATCIQPVYEEFIRASMDESGTEFDSLTVGKLNVTPAGDETVAYRITIAGTQSGFTQELFADIVIIRSGRALASPTFQSRNTPFDIDDMEDLIAVAASRLPAG